MLVWGLLVFALVVLFCIWQNNDITITEISFYSQELPPGFEGYRVVQISDLHNKSFGQQQKRLYQAVAALQPDLIVCTGDLVDSRRPDLEPVLELARQLTALAPVYAVSGNHEARLPNYESEIAPALTAAGVVVLDDRQVVLERQGSQLGLLGLSDPDFGRYQDMTSQIQQLAAANGQTFSLLLCHRPEYASCYQQAGVDLVFCGHAHGGQFRLPGLGGLFAPGQGFLPRYTAGAYSLDATTMVVSRGLGNSLFPLRLGNRPDVVLVTLSQGA